MPAQPKGPWYRSDRDTWYVTRGGKQVPLARGKRNKAEAMQAFHAMMARKPEPRLRTARVSLGELRDTYLESVKSRLRPATIKKYSWAVRTFVKHLGEDTPADDVSEIDVLRWLDHTGEASSAKATLCGILKAMFSKAVDWKMVPDNRITRLSIRHVKTPKPVPTTEQAQRIMEAAEEPTRTLIRFLWATGGRPSEIAALRAEHLHRSLTGWVARLKSKTSGATGRLRTLRFPDSLTPLLDTLVSERQGGSLLRRSNGKPWTPDSMEKSFRDLRKKLGYGPECCPGSFRHLWITDMLEAGVPIATVAELAGNSPAIISKHYSRLRHRTAHLDEAANRVR